MRKDSSAPSPGPRPAVRRLLTLLLLAHFVAIFTAVMSSSSASFPAPALAVWANEPFRPYLQATFLNNAYRFFAPNPGTPTILWFRVQYHDRSVRWVQMPEPTVNPLRLAYQRRLNLANQLGGHLMPAPDKEGQRRFSPLGQICVESFARHVAASSGRTGPSGATLPIKSVGVYAVAHTPLFPEQIRRGWEVNDLRTYQAIFAGAYTPDGVRIDGFKPDVSEKPIFEVAAGILAVDVLPRLPKGDPAAFLNELNLPEPIRVLLDRFPELLDPQWTQKDLQGRIEDLLAQTAPTK